MTMFVIRHASAGARSQFDGDDLQRPLDAHGIGQAEAIADALRGHHIVRLLSSEAVRCTQTLEPLSSALGIAVEHHEALTEGARPVNAVELVRELSGTDGDVAVCSHGDVIPAILTTLAHEGTVLIGGRGCDKGSVWELVSRGRDIVSARYYSAAALSRDLAST
jgi:8-oxo-dGTP diphosphatase